jgi:hypothetical protein
MTATAVERVGAPARLEAYRDAMLKGDASLDDFLNFLRELAAASIEDLAPDIADRDKARAVALGHVQGALQAVGLHAMSRFAADVRSAPADGLNDMVFDYAQPCRNPACSSKVLPWEGVCDGFCSDECERVGEERGWL